MREIKYLKSYGKHYFDIDEVGATVFGGSLGFRSDIKAYSYRHKKFNIVRYDDTDWIEGSVLLKITKYIQKIDNNQAKIEFAAFLKKEGVRCTRRKFSTMVWKEVGFRQKWCCNKCRLMLKPTFQLDHIISLNEDGGEDDINNLQGLCVDCHATKTRDRRLQEVVYSFKTSPIQVKTSKYFDDYNYRPKKRIKLES